jgi:hypothetical protein
MIVSDIAWISSSHRELFPELGVLFFEPSTTLLKLREVRGLACAICALC